MAVVAAPCRLLPQHKNRIQFRCHKPPRLALAGLASFAQPQPSRLRDNWQVQFASRLMVVVVVVMESWDWAPCRRRRLHFRPVPEAVAGCE